MITQVFRVAHSDQVQAAIREHNHDGFELEYKQTALGFDCYIGSTRIAIVAFWGTQPAIRVESVKLKSAALLIGDTAVDLVGEMIVLLAREHYDR